ncbi:heterokaryon incompatibility, partial [Bimuria novae-zelandiae CBS 107.79]
YTCLSYVWGKSYDEHFEILIEEPDYHRSGTFSVRRNLNDFLEVARIKHHSISLWIDAICIDQDNNQERNHQVEQMGEIYRNATRVFA